MRRVPVDMWIVFVAVAVGVIDAMAFVPSVIRDSIRLVEVFLGLYVFVVAATIAKRYYGQYQQDPSRARLLPRHVARLGAGVALLTVVAVALVISLIGQPFLWYATPIVLPGLTILALGLYDMLEWMPTRPIPPGSTSAAAFHKTVADMPQTKGQQ